jgi:hypothetical protein
MNKVFFILALLIGALSVQVNGQVKPKIQGKNMTRAFQQFNHLKTGKPIKPTESIKSKTPIAQTEVILNTGDPVMIPKQPRLISETPKNINNFNCTERTYSFESMPVWAFNPLDKVLFESIYPGQIIDAADLLKSKAPSDFPLPAKYTRKPYQLEYVGFDKLNGKAFTVPIVKADNDHFPATIQKMDWKVAHDNFFVQIGNTKPTVNSYIEYKEIHSLQQIETELGVSISIGISPDAMTFLSGIPVGIDANVDINNKIISNKKKTRILARIVTEFYQVNAAPEGSYKNFITPTYSPDLPSSLAYVKSITYGTVRYIMFESTKVLEELKRDIDVGLDIEVGSEILDIDGGGVSVGIDSEFLSKIEKEEITVKAFGIGLNGEKYQTLKTQDDILNWFMRFDPFGNGNTGKPIRFDVKYLKDDAIASITYIGKIANVECEERVENSKYDVKLRLYKIQGVKIDEGVGGDDSEDVHGKVYLQKSQVGNQIKETKIIPPNPSKGRFNVEIDYAYMFFKVNESRPFQLRKDDIEWKEDGKFNEIIIARDVTKEM